MFLGVADPAFAFAEGVDRAAIPVAKGLGHVAAFQVGGANRLDGGSPRQQLAGRSGPFGSEPLVGSGGNTGRAIDHIEFQVIEVGDFVHRLGDREAKDAIGGLELLGRDGDRFVAVGLAVDARSDQVAEAASAQEIADADEAPAVPREKDRATARLAVVLGQVELLVGRDIELALHHPVGPAEVDQVGLIVFARAQARPERSIGTGLFRASCGRR